MRQHLRGHGQTRPLQKMQPLHEVMGYPEKNKARNKFLGLLKGREVRQIFTLPGEKGLCAKGFRAIFPDSYIVGIEHKESSSKSSELLDKSVVDAYYKMSVAEAATTVAPRPITWLKSRYTNARRVVGRPDPKLPFGPFDVAFLDYCGQPTPRLIKDSVDFLNARMAEKYIAAITFNIPSTAESAGSLDFIRHILNATGTVLLLEHPYETKTKMIIFVIERV